MVYILHRERMGVSISAFRSLIFDLAQCNNSKATALIKSLTILRLCWLCRAIRHQQATDPVPITTGNFSSRQLAPRQLRHHVQAGVAVRPVSRKPTKRRSMQESWLDACNMAGAWATSEQTPTCAGSHPTLSDLLQWGAFFTDTGIRGMSCFPTSLGFYRRRWCMRILLAATASGR